jgi:RNA polymerase sigma factor (sigma-70 family)
MRVSGQALLLQTLLDDYGPLRSKLARRLGSPDAADDVLQEAYLRLGRIEEPGVIQHPRSYLFRIALNIAADRRRSEARRLDRSEVELLLKLEHDELDPERVAAGRSSMRQLVQALEQLPDRRRTIFLAARTEGRAISDIAAQFGISTRMVERELKQALDHCREHLEINLSHKFGPGHPVASKD